MKKTFLLFIFYLSINLIWGQTSNSNLTVPLWLQGTWNDNSNNTITVTQNSIRISWLSENDIIISQIESVSSVIFDRHKVTATESGDFQEILYHTATTTRGPFIRNSLNPIHEDWQGIWRDEGNSFLHLEKSTVIISWNSSTFKNPITNIDNDGALWFGSHKIFKSHSNSRYLMYESTRLSSQRGPFAINATGITISARRIEIQSLDTRGLSVKFTPENTSNINVRWSSNNKNVADVDDNGVVTGIASGQATITAISDDGGHTAICNITVIEPIGTPETLITTPVREIIYVAVANLNLRNAPNSNNDRNIVRTLPFQTEMEILESNGTWNRIRAKMGSNDVEGWVFNLAPWTSDTRPSIVNPITVSSVPDSNQTEYIDPTIHETNTIIVPTREPEIVGEGLGSETIRVTSVTLNKQGFLVLYPGETEVLIATVEPTNAPNRNVIWSSDNNRIATVSSTGLVRAIEHGLTNITVRTVSDHQEDTIQVYIRKPISKWDEFLGINLNAGISVPRMVNTSTNDKLDFIIGQNIGVSFNMIYEVWLFEAGIMYTLRGFEDNITSSNARINYLDFSTKSGVGYRYGYLYGGIAFSVAQIEENALFKKEDILFLSGAMFTIPILDDYRLNFDIGHDWGTHNIINGYKNRNFRLTIGIGIPIN
ncbi:MAG: Ig-like domain-containing protein [Candidatus Cloacimonetes bacterium]|nr:Ig-like domain-containing protein [Candidatus Cloacimonadota bacterium]